MNVPRTVLAQNASPLTLDGTRTFIVGSARAAVIDPGPDLPQHLDALLRALRGASSLSIILTHRHPDHADGALPLARSLAGELGVSCDPLVPSDGDNIPTDAGDLVALATPGHTPDHISVHWPAGSAIFCGDLMMGGMDTALVAVPEGNLADYLRSLDRLAALAPAVIYPAHGPQFADPGPALVRYRAHRAERVHAVLAALNSGRRGLGEIAEQVYGAVGPELLPWVRATTNAYLEYLVHQGLTETGAWHDD